MDEGSRGLPGISLGTNDRDEGLEEILRVEAVDLEGFVEPVEPAEVAAAAGPRAAEETLGGGRPHRSRPQNPSPAVPRMSRLPWATAHAQPSAST